MGKRVLLGMSGGVDSSVSAILLQEAGYEVIGITFMMFDGADCREDAKRVCDNLNIQHIVYDCQSTFKKYVQDYFANSYDKLETPNPCIECNKYLKFGLMSEIAKEQHCDYIATGHYAHVTYNKQYDCHVIEKIDSRKDQSYVLYSIHRDVIPSILFPLASFKDKEEIRQIARDHHLDIANKPDSEDICFISDGDYKKYLLENTHIIDKPGDIVLEDGTIVGRHQGLFRYTIGQRKGLGISHPFPLFVLEFNKQKNQLIVGSKESLFKKEIIVDQLNFHLLENFNDGLDILVKIRYAAPLVPAKIYHDHQDVKIIFTEPQMSPTPGQSAVFYLDKVLMGGGKIKRV